MKNILCEYIVVIIFQNKTEDEKKRQVNQKIKNLATKMLRGFLFL